MPYNHDKIAIKLSKEGYFDSPADAMKALKRYWELLVKISPVDLAHLILDAEAGKF